ncbi:hypothetical protein [Burkholderia sp.]|uniref:hypothetical protein n=1 Tax=Burkholderia sp. TaxID=36773 RepID=UPI0025C04CF8|nr:hypothetical protein [Burkholderia sp.]MBS6360094.1 hypothetical protein [Burkholderia sp.]
MQRIGAKSTTPANGGCPRRSDVYLGVSTLQADCSLSCQGFCGFLRLRAIPRPIGEKIGNKKQIALIFATIVTQCGGVPVSLRGIPAAPARSGTLWHNRRHLLRLRITARRLSKASLR